MLHKRDFSVYTVVQVYPRAGARPGHLDAVGVGDLSTVGAFHQGCGGRTSVHQLLLPLTLSTENTHRRVGQARLETGRDNGQHAIHTHTGREGVHWILTARHCRIMQPFFMRPGPPNLLMSLQKLHSPHSFLWQAAQCLQRTRLRLRAEIEVGLARRGTTALWGMARRGRYTTEGGGGWYHEGWGGGRGDRKVRKLVCPCVVETLTLVSKCMTPVC